jgi:hypothetical protein
MTWCCCDPQPSRVRRRLRRCLTFSWSFSWQPSSWPSSWPFSLPSSSPLYALTSFRRALWISGRSAVCLLSKISRSANAFNYDACRAREFAMSTRFFTRSCIVVSAARDRSMPADAASPCGFAPSAYVVGPAPASLFLDENGGPRPRALAPRVCAGAARAGGCGDAPGIGLRGVERARSRRFGSDEGVHACSAVPPRGVRGDEAQAQ